MNKKSKVILLPCSSYREEIVYENLEIGLELLGGIEKIVKKEESILLKPNLLKKAEVDKAVITHPSVVGMFARLMREKGYQDLSLADSCGNGTTTRVIHGTGIDRYLEKYGITAIDYSKGIRVEYPEGIQTKEFILPKELLEKDCVISLCKMKTHALERITGAVKNSYGNIDLRHAVKKITKPVSFIISSDIKANYKTAQEYRKLNSNIDITYVSNCKLYPQLENPEKVYQIIENKLSN